MNDPDQTGPLHRGSPTMHHLRRSRTTVTSALILVLAIILGLTFSSTGSAVAQEANLEVVPAAEIAEIGNDLVFTITLDPPAGRSVAAGSVTAEIVTAAGVAFFDDPYPLKPLTAATSGATDSRQLAFEWAAPIKPEADPGNYDLTVRVHYRLDGPDAVAHTAIWTGPVAVDFGEEWSADRITYFIKDRGLFLFLLLVFGFGILMSFSPCIYPMIPITLAVIGAQSQQKGALQGLLLSLTYALGLAMVYAILGALSATVFSGITAFMQSPWILIPIAVLMVVLAIAMFGAFELQAPAFLRDRLQGPGANRGGLIGVFFMGMVAGLVASPCVGPFLAALLLWIATTGSVVLGFWSLFLFGLGMSSLLVAVGTFPALLGSMPTSGGWMESVKKAMGLLLLAMAFFFVRPGLVMPAHIFYPLLGMVTVMVSIYLGAFDPVAPGCHWWDRARKGIGLIVLVLGLYLLGSSLLRYGFLLPDQDTSEHVAVQVAAAPANAGAVSAATTTGSAAAVTATPKPTKVPWTVIHTGENVQAFLDEKIAEAQRTGQPIVIDFWATWCKICHVLDKKVWVDPGVVAESARFITQKAAATESDAEMEAIWRDFRISGLPTVVFIDSRGKILHGKSVSGFLAAPEMLVRMQSIR